MGDCVSLHIVRRSILSMRLARVASVVNRKQSLVLYGQATKRTRWMPRQLEAMKDVGACEKSRGAGKHALIRECPNGETHLP
jgi:hypothetical protein